MKTVIFDLDGTLLNTLEDVNDSINIALKKYNIRPNTLSETKTYLGNGAKTLILRSMYHKYDIGLFLKNALFDEIYNDYLNNYKELRLNKTKPYDGIVEVLNSLKNDGYKLAVLSNKPDKDTKPIIDYYFKDIFDLVSGGSTNIPLKPNPTSLLKLINDLDSDINNTIYVGDSLVDINTAKNANVKCISVSYGYNLAEILIRNNDIVVDNPLDILKVIKNDN